MDQFKSFAYNANYKDFSKYYRFVLQNFHEIQMGCDVGSIFKAVAIYDRSEYFALMFTFIKHYTNCLIEEKDNLFFITWNKTFRNITRFH